MQYAAQWRCTFHIIDHGIQIQSTPWGAYNCCCTNPMETTQSIYIILCVLSSSAEGFKEAQGEFIELYLFMELSFFTRSKEVQDIHHRVAQKLRYTYNGNVFQVSFYNT